LNVKHSNKNAKTAMKRFGCFISVSLLFHRRSLDYTIRQSINQSKLFYSAPKS